MPPAGALPAILAGSPAKQKLVTVGAVMPLLLIGVKTGSIVTLAAVRAEVQPPAFAAST